MILSEKASLVEEILTIADNLFRQLLPSVPRELLELDITMPQLKIMLILFIRGAVRMSTIASDLDVTFPTATNLVDRLVEKGYVTRESLAEDRRVVLCRLSESGQATISRIWDVAKSRSRLLLEELDVARLKMFNNILKSMLDSASVIKIEEPGG